MDKPPRRRRRSSLSDDPVAETIKEWWAEKEGPHHMPLIVSSNNAKNLADHLRSRGFIKDDIAVVVVQDD